MKLTAYGPNQTIVHLNNGDSVFFSYNTPVAANIQGKFYKTLKFWSNTTTRHINKFLAGAKAESYEQEFFDNLVK